MGWIAAITLALLACTVRAESAGAAPAQAPTAKPTGPLVELTPLDGAIFTAYLLSMKDGTLDLETPAGEVRHESASTFKSVRFVAVTQPTTPAPKPPEKSSATTTATGTATGTGTSTATAHELAEQKKREDHKRFMELMRKWRLGGKLTPTEQSELNELADRLPNLRVVGGVVFLKQMMNAEEDAKAASGVSKLNEYMAKARVQLKEATSEMEARVQVLRLAFAYRQENVPLVKMIEQLEGDIGTMNKEALRTATKEKLQHFLDIWFFLNGERMPKY